mmetsp:Transcript_87090/g.106818  ORF Transcript_87090/g.106818 Transcript_87090/m.106818 type:complete len:128 (+) Transcript_87090:100-483(+)
MSGKATVLQSAKKAHKAVWGRKAPWAIFSIKSIKKTSNNDDNNNNNNVNIIKRKVIKNCPKCINGKFTIKTIILQEGSKECNQCSKISKPKEIFYKCNNCGYDICPHCYHKVPMKLLKYKKNNNNIE